MIAPLVSIVIPVFNGANYLSQAIDSALAQTYSNIEIIVVNDGSDDNKATEEIALSYGEKIQYCYKENGGVSSALNLGISRMHGEWFSWLSHDDLFSPERIERAIEAIWKFGTRAEKIVFKSGGCLITSEKKIIKKVENHFIVGELFSGHDVVKSMIEKSTLNGCCLLIHRDALRDVGGFDESLRYSQDALMWYRLFLKGYELCQLEGIDVFSRVHNKQVTHNRKDLFYHDACIVAEKLAPALAHGFISDGKEYNAFFKYSQRLAKYQCVSAVCFMLDYSEHEKLLSGSERRAIKCTLLFGKLVLFFKALIRKIIVQSAR